MSALWPHAPAGRKAGTERPGLTLTLDYTHFTRAGLPDSEVEPLLNYASHFHGAARANSAFKPPFAQNTLITNALHPGCWIGYKGWVGIEYVWIDWNTAMSATTCRDASSSGISSAPLRRKLEKQMMIETKSNVPVEITFTAAASYTHPFHEIMLDVLFTDPEGVGRRVPAFWAGGDTWRVRYASPLPGTHTFHTECNVTADSGLHGAEGSPENHALTKARTRSIGMARFGRGQ